VLADIVKIKITALEKEHDEILKKIQELEVVQIESEKDGGEEIRSHIVSGLDYNIAELRFALDFIALYKPPQKGIKKFLESGIFISRKDAIKTAESFDYQTVVKESKDLEEQINKRVNLIDKNNSEINILRPWHSLNIIPGKELPAGYKISFILLSEKSVDEFSDNISRDLPFSAFEKTNIENQELYSYVIHKEEDEDKLKALFETMQVREMELPKLDMGVSEYVENLNNKIKESSTELNDLKKEAGKLSRHERELKIVHDFLSWQKMRAENEQKEGKTNSTFTIYGWIDKENIDELNVSLAQITTLYHIEEIGANDEEVPPVKFKNTWSKPFESVTSLYGMPQPSEPDPTPFLAPFFTLFFGLAITDAGYGIVLALISYLAVKIFKIPKEDRGLFGVVFWGGIASVVLGAVFGGWFGVELSKMPGFLRGPLESMQILNPLENPIAILYLSLVLGIIQVLFGLGINTWWQIKKGKIKSALLGSGLWLIGLISLLVFAASSGGLLPVALAVPFKYLTLLIAVGIVVSKWMAEKNKLLGLPIGVLGLYDVVGYFSDVLSYSRLLALGLTTSIIGMVVNIVAGLAMEMPFVGWLAGLLVLIGGHVFNIGINALGAFIHSGRLQYIEFFPKFMEGGGRAFQPMKMESKYIQFNEK